MELECIQWYRGQVNVLPDTNRADVKNVLGIADLPSTKRFIPWFTVSYKSESKGWYSCTLLQPLCVQSLVPSSFWHVFRIFSHFCSWFAANFNVNINISEHKAASHQLASIVSRSHKRFSEVLGTFLSYSRSFPLFGHDIVFCRILFVIDIELTHFLSWSVLAGRIVSW